VAWIVALVLSAVVGAMLFLAGFLVAGGSGGSRGCSAPHEAFDAFCEAYAKLKGEYVDELDDAKLAEGAIRGMFQYGVEDPYSAYMPPTDYQSALGDLSGKFEGIGAEMALKNTADEGNLEACTELSDSCVLVVVAPIAGSPAEAAGLQSGDYVRAVDGESVNGSTMHDQINRVRGEAGTEVTLTIERSGETFDVTITRAEIQVQEVEARMLEPGIGYISLNGFSDASPDQFRTALSGLLDEGAEQIVFDLRDNPGGYIVAAQEIASEFIETGLIFSQESSGDEVKEWEATGDGVATDPSIEVVVLVNGGSASASEIVSAALKESGRATVVGQPTFGKDTVQVWAPLENEGGVRITISRWFTPSHGSVAPAGVQPDVAVEVPPDAAPEEDLFVEAALDALRDSAVGEEVAPPPSSSPSARLLEGLGPIAFDANGRARAAA
jgi:carboxyl-terminal processing protease